MKKILNALASPKMFFWSVAWLMVLVFVGTLEQKSIGLYQAQEKYFSSFFFWVGPLPLPGGYFANFFVLIGLIAKLTFKTHWRLANLGVAITHIGALSLLVGGILTAVFNEEGALVVEEGGSSNSISDYYDVELAVIDVSEKGSDKEYLFPEVLLKPEQKITNEAWPFRIKILKFCQNCRLLQRSLTPGNEFKGMAVNFDLIPIDRFAKEEENRAGLVFGIEVKKSESTKNEDSQNGIYAIVEDSPVEQRLVFEGKEYVLQIRAKTTYLPFAIKLIDFRREVYPGTDTPKSFESLVAVKDPAIENGVEQKFLIQMNEPLRYKGYIFYQSSFMQGDLTETSVLAVVKNVGRNFPYISSLIMCLGLLLHLFLQLPRWLGSEKKAKAGEGSCR